MTLLRLKEDKKCRPVHSRNTGRIHIRTGDGLLCTNDDEWMGYIKKGPISPSRLSFPFVVQSTDDDNNEEDNRTEPSFLFSMFFLFLSTAAENSSSPPFNKRINQRSGLFPRLGPSSFSFNAWSVSLLRGPILANIHTHTEEAPFQILILKFFCFFCLAAKAGKVLLSLSFFFFLLKKRQRLDCIYGCTHSYSGNTPQCETGSLRVFSFSFQLLVHCNTTPTL